MAAPYVGLRFMSTGGINAGKLVKEIRKNTACIK